MTQYGPYTAHPVAEWFPLLGEVELAEMAESIRQEGQIEEITVWRGLLVDGRNRWRACELAEVEPVVNEVAFTDDNEAARWIIAKNVHRRHLSTSQRAMLASKALPLYEVGQGARTDLKAPDEPPANLREVSNRKDRESSAQAAEVFNVSPRSVQQAKTVNEHGVPALALAVERGEVAVSAAAEVAKLPEYEQQKLVEQGPKAVQQAAAERRKAHVVNNSGNDEWYTPAFICDAARLAMGGIDLDPASCEIANRQVQAAEFYTLEDDGLEEPWRGRVWLNPPYSQPLMGKFIERVCRLSTEGEIDQACVLVNNGTDTVAGQRLLSTANAVCFIEGRVKFIDETGEPKKTPLQGQMVAYLGSEIDAFVGVFNDLGVVMVRAV